MANNTKPGALLIIRGLPGSGKSTLAAKIAKETGAVRFENDQYLITNGKYTWTQDTARLAARRCFEDTINSLKSGNNTIVSNVFVTVNAIDKYVRAAEGIGARVQVFRMTNDFGNVHNVPENTLKSMASSFQDYPGEKPVGKTGT